MSGFKSFETRYPLVREVDGFRCICYWIQEPICWIAQDAVRHHLPAFMVSDGYSIPSWLRSSIRGLKSRLPAYLHDYQFWVGDYSLWTTNNNIRKAVIDTGGGRYNAWKIWAGLQVGGWVAWNRYKRERRAGGKMCVANRHIAKTLEDALAISSMGDC